MKFSGRLQIEADPRNWLKSELSVNQGRVELVSGGELLGSWSTGQVKAERLEGDRFQLQLGDDRAVFAADDALAFSYEALPALAKKSVIAVASGLRGKLRKGLASAATSQPDEQSDADPQAYASAAPIQPHLAETGLEPPPTRRLRDLIQEAVKSNAAATTAQTPGSGWGSESVTLDHGSELDGNAGGQPSDPMSAAELRDWAPTRPPANEEAVPSSQGMPAERTSVDSGWSSPDPLAMEAPPVIAEPAALSDTLGRVRPLRPVPPVESAGRNGGTPLGERPPERVGWAQAVRGTASAIGSVDASAPVDRTLDTIIEGLRKSEMSPAQIVALTDLVKAVADAIQGKNRP